LTPSSVNASPPLRRTSIRPGGPAGGCRPVSP